MNVEASTTPQSITDIASPEQLVAAREARGWSMSDVAAKLGMMPRQIEAIEQGRWEALPGNAFVRGAIRAYGKALQLDVAPLLSTLGPKSSAPELRPSSSLDSPLPRHGALGFDNGGSGSRIVWILLGVIGVIAIAMYFGRGADFGQALDSGNGSAASSRALEVVPIAPGAGSQGGAPDAASGGTTAGAGTSATPQTTATPGASATPGAPSGPGTATSPGSSTPPAASSTIPGASSSTGAAAASSAADATPTTPGSPGAGAPAVAGPASAAPPATPATPAAGASVTAGGAPSAAGSEATSAASAADAAASTSGAALTGAALPGAAGAPTPAADSLVLHFERESWVDVRDATGKVLLMGTQPANSTREVSGQKPYSMTIGNATYVRVEHGGRNVDLGAVTQKGVARVRVE